MNASVSVVIPVKDGARYLDEVLAAVFAQEDGLEVLVIDSGSRDGSADIARAAGAEVLEIAPDEFGHGRTRNLGAEQTSGELICFLTQDATPLPGWLAALREALALEDRVGAAFGPHLPRPDTSPMIARELTEFFAGFSPNGSPAVHRAGDEPFLSNVNACYRRECWDEIRFADVPYSEDQTFGRAMLASGWLKVFHPRAAVLHAHDYAPIAFLRRYFDEYRGLRSSLGHVEGFGVRSSARAIRERVAGDRRWMHERGWPASAQAIWTARSLFHHTGRKVFSTLGSHSERLPASMQRAISLEGRPNRTTSPPAARASKPTRARGLGPFEAIHRVRVDGPAPLSTPVPGMAEAARLHVAVVIPCFERGSGGHSTIYNLLTRLEQRGHTASTWLHDPNGYQSHEWPAVVRRNLGEYFRPYRGPVFKGFGAWHGADVVVATGWETVHPVLTLDRCRARAYLVQDHEPEFFPTSAEGLWARETYTAGLYCITAGEWLRELLETRYGAHASSFDLGVDHDIYHQRSVVRRDDTVVFYARDATPRRGVPMGLLALAELHRRRPGLRFVLFGDHKRPVTPFPYEHLGIASPEELSWAFSEATVGLSLSLTNHSLIPQEMLACGLPVVELAGENVERVFGADGPLELAAPDPIEIADALLQLIDDPGRRARRAEAGLSFVADRTWERAAIQLENGLRAALREREFGRAPGGASEPTTPTAVPPPSIWEPTARTVPIAYAEGSEATDRLYSRLSAEDVAAVERRLDESERAYWAQSHDAHQRLMTLVYGTWHRVSAVIEKTGLSPEQPPDSVHAMARGPLAAGGDLYYADLLADALRRVGGSMDDVRRGLDFGCSSGRVVRALNAAWPDADWHGADPNADAIAWASENLPGIRFLRSPQEPPLPYGDASFDFVYAISIWSHFGDHAALTWLEEMRRITRPGGRLVLTTHGLQSVAFYGSIGERTPAQLERIREALYRRGFWFADEFGESGDWGIRHPEWGTAFLTPEWLASHACPQWAIDDFAVGQNAENQDLYVLRRGHA
jgi:glycosyltransferase involved in cell wall biosynthesis